MQHTQNYNFDLPEENDEMETATRTALNDNFSDLDTLLKDVEDDIDDVKDDISGLNAKTGEDIPFESGSADSISDKITNLDNSVGDKPSGETDTLWDKVDTLANRGTYSTTEQVIGTWINGKPIYRKVILEQLVLPVSGDWVTTSLAMTNIAEITNIMGLKYSADGICPIICQAVSPYVQICTTRNGSNIILKGFIVEYTKITD